MTIRPLVLLLALVTLGCGSGVDTHPLDIDASIDAPGQDIDAPIALTAHHYVMDKQLVPLSNTQARELGLDLNGDAIVDNQLGMVMATLSGQGFEVQAPNDLAIDRGTILMLVDLEADGFTSGPATFTLFSGANPNPAPCNGGGDTVCRHHLEGTASFNVAGASAHDTPLAGSLTAGVLATTVTATGKLQLQTALLSSTPQILDLVGARVKVTSVSATGITTGVIAGALTVSEVNTKILPAWQQAANASIAADCGGAPPDCGCTAGSTGKTNQQLFDISPRDCTISLSEIQNNTLIQSLLAPDLMIDGTPALSFGIGFTATSATFTP